MSERSREPWVLTADELIATRSALESLRKVVLDLKLEESDRFDAAWLVAGGALDFLEEGETLEVGDRRLRGPGLVVTELGLELYAQVEAHLAEGST